MPRTVREPASGPAPSQPIRADLPGALEHVGEVDEFDAALVRGAGGVPLEPAEAANGAGESTAAPKRPARRQDRERGSSTELEEAFGEGVAAEAVPIKRPTQPVHVRAIAFLRASWAELQRVQWPDRPHVTQATAVVLGFLVVAGLYLGAADWVAQKIVNLVL